MRGSEIQKCTKKMRDKREGDQGRGSEMGSKEEGERKRRRWGGGAGGRRE